MRFVSLVVLFFSLDALAQIRPFQTTRLQSTSGAGVASMLVTEAAVLNPATLAFFSETFASYHNTRTTLRNTSDERKADDRQAQGDGRHEGYFVFDNAGETKGGLSYQRQRENGFTRQRMTATMATNIGSDMSLGFLYKHTDDLRPVWYNSRHKVSHPMTLGFSWIVRPDLTLGAIWDDPTRATPGESRAVAGAQYALTADLLVIADGGGDPTRSFSDTRTLRGALQFNFFSDFFLRVGKFEDKALNLEGESWGFSWIGPKLSVEFAMKNSRTIEKEVSYLYQSEKLADLSFSAGVRF
jgi:hypothetical protein